MSKTMILDYNLADPSRVANARVSSAQAAFPVANAYNIDKRRKVWRSNGHWHITSANQSLTFQESMGVNLVALVPTGDYASDALFFAALKAAMESAGVKTYTISRDTTTGRIQVATSFTFLSLQFAASAAMATLLGFSNTNRTGATTYTADLLRIASDEWLEWDFGFPANPSALACFGDRNRPLKISPNATIVLQAGWTRNWTAPSLEITIPYREFQLYTGDDQGLADISDGYRYWRLKIVDLDNANDYIELGAVFLGTHAVLTRGCPIFPFEPKDIDRSSVTLSLGGQTVADKVDKAAQIPLLFSSLDIASKEALDAVWNYYGLTSSFIIALDPNDVFSSDGATWVRLVKFDSAPDSSLQTVGIWSYQWTLREEL